MFLPIHTQNYYIIRKNLCQQMFTISIKNIVKQMYWMHFCFFYAQAGLDCSLGTSVCAHIDIIFTDHIVYTFSIKISSIILALMSHGRFASSSLWNNECFQQSFFAKLSFFSSRSLFTSESEVSTQGIRYLCLLPYNHRSHRYRCRCDVIYTIPAAA